LGIELAGDFGDPFEDLESMVFDVDYTKEDGLELLQDAGDFAGFATQAPPAGDAVANPVGKGADASIVDDAFGLTLEDVADLEVAFEFVKRISVSPRSR
jgi:hypothetical protein